MNSPQRAVDGVDGFPAICGYCLSSLSDAVARIDQLTWMSEEAKAVAAASLALRGDGTHVVPLDACIETMRQTGRDMSVKYKETSTGGLAVNLPEC